MNHDYQKVLETMQEVGIDESYIGKTLKLYGLEEFPKSGLDDTGLSKLVKTATEIFHSEASLTTRKTKKGYLPAPKIKKEKAKNSGSLENSIMKEDLKKAGKTVLKIVTYPIGIIFTAPTMVRKGFIKDDDPLEFPGASPFVLSLVGNMILWASLYYRNPKLVPYVLATQITTNLASGIYEYVRHIKNKTEERKAK